MAVGRSASNIYTPRTHQLAHPIGEIPDLMAQLTVSAFASRGHGQE
jgi:hypothetical protein